MAVSVLARLHSRRFININNNVGIFLANSMQCLNNKIRLFTTGTDEDIFTSENKSNKKISKVMTAYINRAKEHDELIKKQIAEYEIGKRHLANIMGEDPEFFTQADINRSIEYLLPSGLFDRKARPMMRHPNEIYPSRKAAEFDEFGRPFHSMFYTSNPNYCEVLYNIVDKIKSLNDIEDSLIKQGILPETMDKIDLIGSTWLSKKDIEQQLLESLKDLEYNYLITSLERFCEHPLSKRETEFIMNYRKKLVSHTTETVIPPVEYNHAERPYITVKNCMRKSARGEVTIWGNGSGKISVNKCDITYFKNMDQRKQMRITPRLLAGITGTLELTHTARSYNQYESIWQ